MTTSQAIGTETVLKPTRVSRIQDAVLEAMWENVFGELDEEDEQEDPTKEGSYSSTSASLLSTDLSAYSQKPRTICVPTYHVQTEKDKKEVFPVQDDPIVAATLIQCPRGKNSSLSGAKEEQECFRSVTTESMLSDSSGSDESETSESESDTSGYDTLMTADTTIPEVSLPDFHAKMAQEIIRLTELALWAHQHDLESASDALHLAVRRILMCVGKPEMLAHDPTMLVSNSLSSIKERSTIESSNREESSVHRALLVTAILQETIQKVKKSHAGTSNVPEEELEEEKLFGSSTSLQSNENDEDNRKETLATKHRTVLRGGNPICTQATESILETLQQAILSITDLTRIESKGGFALDCFMANDFEVVRSLSSASSCSDASNCSGRIKENELLMLGSKMTPMEENVELSASKTMIWGIDCDMEVEKNVVSLAKTSDVMEMESGSHSEKQTFVASLGKKTDNSSPSLKNTNSQLVSSPRLGFFASWGSRTKKKSSKQFLPPKELVEETCSLPSPMDETGDQDAPQVNTFRNPEELVTHQAVELCHISTQNLSTKDLAQEQTPFVKEDTVATPSLHIEDIQIQTSQSSKSPHVEIISNDQQSNNSDNACSDILSSSPVKCSDLSTPRLCTEDFQIRTSQSSQSPHVEVISNDQQSNNSDNVVPQQKDTSDMSPTLDSTKSPTIPTKKDSRKTTSRRSSRSSSKIVTGRPKTTIRKGRSTPSLQENKPTCDNTKESNSSNAANQKKLTPREIRRTAVAAAKAKTDKTSVPLRKARATKKIPSTSKNSKPSNLLPPASPSSSKPNQVKPTNITQVKSAHPKTAEAIRSRLFDSKSGSMDTNDAAKAVEPVSDVSHHQRRKPKSPKTMEVNPSNKIVGVSPTSKEVIATTGFHVLEHKPQVESLNAQSSDCTSRDQSFRNKGTKLKKSRTSARKDSLWRRFGGSFDEFNTAITNESWIESQLGSYDGSKLSMPLDLLEALGISERG